MIYADIHMHALYGVDDGAESPEEMMKIIKKAYRDGTRDICLTPHFSSEYFGSSTEQTVRSFELLEKICSIHYPDLSLYLGNEIRYFPDCIISLRKGLCRTINNTRYVLIDFSADEKEETILNAAEMITGGGFIPIIAHIERYTQIKKISSVEQLKEIGAVIQIDASSLLGRYGSNSKHKSKKLISKKLADLIAGDAHNVTSRPPEMAECYRYLRKHTDAEYANNLCLYNPLKILGAKAL